MARLQGRGWARGEAKQKRGALSPRRPSAVKVALVAAQPPAGALARWSRWPLSPSPPQPRHELAPTHWTWNRLAPAWAICTLPQGNGRGARTTMALSGYCRCASCCGLTSCPGEVLSRQHGSIWRQTISTSCRYACVDKVPFEQSLSVRSAVAEELLPRVHARALRGVHIRQLCAHCQPVMLALGADRARCQATREISGGRPKTRLAFPRG